MLWEEYKMWRDIGTIGRTVGLVEALALDAVHQAVKPWLGAAFEDLIAAREEEE